MAIRSQMFTLISHKHAFIEGGNATLHKRNEPIFVQNDQKEF